MKKHGIGEALFDNGYTKLYYYGEWKDDSKYGIGRLIYENKEYYIGNFVKNCFEGYGVLHY